MLDVLYLAILIISSYLIGSVSFAIIICKLCRLPDPRTEGSRNPGATNVNRIAGKKYAAVVLLFDFLKGFIPTMLAIFFLQLELFLVLLVGFAAILGHVFSIFHKFKGGKGVSTYLGVLLALLFFPGEDIFVGIIFLIIWLFVNKILKKSSLSALTATFVATVYYCLSMVDVSSEFLMVVIAALIFYTHQDNIKRLIAKEED